MSNKSVNVKIDVDPDRILAKRGLGSSHKARILMASQISEKADPYVPFGLTGLLKNNHTIDIDGSKITYRQKYAAAQWKGSRKTKKGTIVTFKKYSKNFSGLRGPRWTERMMQARGREIVNSVADYVGGKAK